ncbi:zinc-binding dehydrogenase [Companilactobacillus sp. HBUAS59544]|uniref:zinc-binding dehydrogenase n=1 Tax=Companilactobacillus sp. HBUAS59544 TaxID=3109363 RepID=UPI002FEF43F7
MKAIRLTQPCETSEMQPVEVEKPTLKPGFIIIKVKAFGINESEVISRKGKSDSDFAFPRILGIEATGIVDEVNTGSKYQPGQQVVTMMGGMGRAIDGGYAEYVMVKEENVIPFESDLSWDKIGALPEMLQTAYGSLNEGLNLKKDDILFVHGGTSTVGLMAIVLGKLIGAKVIATSRREKSLADLKQYGADYPLIDDEKLESEIKKIAPNGVDATLELVGFTVLFKDMALTRKGGKVCFTGELDGKWTLDNFTPFMIPTGVFLTSYAGESSDLPANMLQQILDDVKAGKIEIPIAHVYKGLESVGQAQHDLESNKYNGKHVVII